MSMKLAARVGKPGEAQDSGLCLGIEYSFPQEQWSGFMAVVLWPDGSMTAEPIETLKANVMDVNLIYAEFDENNKELVEQYSRKAD